MIQLESVDPQSNRFRYYAMDIERILFGFCLTIKWGRIGGRRFHRSLFLSKEKAASEIHKLLLRRKRHDYVVTDYDQEVFGWAPTAMEKFEIYPSNSSDDRLSLIA